MYDEPYNRGYSMRLTFVRRGQMFCAMLIAMLNYHVFKQSTGTARAVTDDRIGEKLPKLQFKAWVYEKEVTINHGGGLFIGADSDEVMEAIERDGYYLLPQSKAAAREGASSAAVEGAKHGAKKVARAAKKSAERKLAKSRGKK